MNATPTGLVSGLFHYGGALMWSIALFSVGINLLALTSPLHMMQVYDRVLASMSETTLIAITAVALFALVIFAVLDMARARLLARLGLRVDTALADRLFRGVIRGASLPNGGVHSYALRDLDTVRGFAASPGLAAFFDAPWLFIFLGVLYLLHPSFAVVGAAGAGLLFGLTVLNEIVTRTVSADGSRAQLRAGLFADAAARCGPGLEAMGATAGAAMHWRAQRHQALALQTIAADREAPITGISRFIRLGLQVGILSLGAHLVIQREITPGAMIAASILVARALAPIEAAVSSWKLLLAARESWERIGATLKFAPRDEVRMPLPKPKGRLDVRGLSFATTFMAPPILTNVSFDLKQGEILGIVGPSGSGKSTLARLLVGVWAPTTGIVRLDGADIATWVRDDVGRHIGFLPQEVELLPGTVQDNIARHTEPNADAVLAAARLAHAHDMILRLSDGYETRVGDGASNLSGGQRQRIGLARALYGNPPFVVLDEPNANLDTEGEEALRRALHTIKQRGASAIVISHRPSVLNAVDTIMVMANGSVEAIGPRAEILARLTRPAAVARLGPTPAPSPNTPQARQGGAILTAGRPT